jgi:hypothetical protein
VINLDFNFIINFIEHNIKYFQYALLFFCVLFLALRLSRKKKKKKKMFYNTGFKLIFSHRDKIKFKIRLGDYDDTIGIRYNYLIAFKLFCWDFYRMKYTDQKGKVYKRKMRFGGIK